MNPQSSPRLIDGPHTASEIAVMLDRLLEGADFVPTGVDPLRNALVRIAARYGEIVTQCLNSAPDLHLQAFAELLGGQVHHAEAARTHVSFKPAAGRRAEPVVVPMNTRLAAPPVEGDSEPVVFETLADLELLPAEVMRARLVNAGHTRMSDAGAMLLPVGFEGDPMTLSEPVANELHIAQRATLGVTGLQQVRVQVGVVDAPSHDLSGHLEWVTQTPKGDLPLAVESDTTGGLSHSGEVVLTAPPAWSVAMVAGVESIWLTLRLRRVPDLTAADASTPPLAWRPPTLSAITIQAIASTAAQPVAAACHDGVLLDISKDAFPFGERPRFGSVFQVQSPAFAEPGAKIEMRVRLTNPEGATSAPIPPVSGEGRPVVEWEISTTSGFRPVGAHDGTRSLTQDGTLMLTIPADVAAVTIAGKSGPWLRARLAAGHYGSTKPTDVSIIAVPRAPAIRSLAVQSTLERGPLAPEHLISQSALTSRQIDPRLPSPVDAFPLPDVDGPTLYIALDAAAEALVKGREINWHVRPALPEPPLVLGKQAPSSTAPRWQMCGADGWSDVPVRDATEGLSRSGIVTLTLPVTPSPWRGSMLDSAPPFPPFAWLRIIWPAEASTRAAPVGLALNSVAVWQSQRIRNEVVGSSNGRSGQVFKALRTPIVGGVRLQVRETDDAWASWEEVDDLSRSHAASRDFTVDRSTGELRFGDGRFGRIPPLGANNIRLREYTTGGGSRGNLPAGAIAQMRSAVPAVESVINVEPATGGLDADDAVRVRSHASAWLRHRDRAVCVDDFADLAQKASAEVARAFCIAGRDLGAGSQASGREPTEQAGVVSVIVIPQYSDPLPQPSLDLLATVKAYLDTRRPPMGRLVIVGPTYAHVAVRLQVVVEGGWSPHEVAAECARRISNYLHPLSGGDEGRGWALGQRPHRSDIHGLLGTVDGVDIVRGLSLALNAPAGMPFVVSAGAIDVSPGESS